MQREQWGRIPNAVDKFGRSTFITLKQDKKCIFSNNEIYVQLLTNKPYANSTIRSILA